MLIVKLCNLPVRLCLCVLRFINFEVCWLKRRFLGVALLVYWRQGFCILGFWVGFPCLGLAFGFWGLTLCFLVWWGFVLMVSVWLGCLFRLNVDDRLRGGLGLVALFVLLAFTWGVFEYLLT